VEISREFLVNISNLGIFIQFLAALIASIYIKKNKLKILQLFLFLLWYTIINEIIAIYGIKFNILKSNIILYNIYHVINFSLLFFIYRKLLNNKKHKLSLLLFVVIYWISFIINGFYEDYFTKIQSIPHILASSFMIFTIIFYFIDILNSTRVLNTNRSLLLWISIGLLIFFTGNIPFRIVRNYYADMEGISALFLINITLTIVMNSCFMIGFISSKRI